MAPPSLYGRSVHQMRNTLYQVTSAHLYKILDSIAIQLQPRSSHVSLTELVIRKPSIEQPSQEHSYFFFISP